MKRLSNLFTVLAFVLSHIMCIVVAFNYQTMLCGIEHEGYSAPAEIGFLYAIPFAIAIILCAILARKLSKR